MNAKPSKSGSAPASCSRNASNWLACARTRSSVRADSAITRAARAAGARIPAGGSSRSNASRIKCALVPPMPNELSAARRGAPGSRAGQRVNRSTT
ncbi:hypothetical protein X948_5164 [Burkholderia pseudomallei MSHR5608]|nr:hypothetical protein X948_5164 [Burkholderia pseudomallei MSHR5608]